MVYQASQTHPYVLAGIHWIPHYDPHARMVFDVAHDATSCLYDHPARRDGPLGQFGKEVCVGETALTPGLFQLAEYVVSRYTCTPPTTKHMRLLALLLMDQLLLEAFASNTKSASPRLLRTQQFAAEHLREPLNIERLAGVAECSRATLTRLFQREAAISPSAWLGQLRIQRAVELLRSTALPIYKIAREVGIDDPYYFSRFFRRHTGQNPRSYRGSSSQL